MPNFIKNLAQTIATELELRDWEEDKVNHILSEELAPLLPEPAETAEDSDTDDLPPILALPPQKAPPPPATFTPTSPSSGDVVELDGFYSDTDDEEEGEKFQDKKRKRKQKCKLDSKFKTRNEWREKQTEELEQVLKKWKASNSPDVLDFILSEFLK